jgi:biopolymer transport protein ExbD
LSATLPGPADAGAPGETLVAEINVTPLVDVVLVLLLTFMVTAPLLRTAVEVEVPEVTTAEPAGPEALVVTIGPEGSIALGERIVSLEDAVSAAVAMRLAHPEGGVFLRADRAAPYGFVMGVLDALRREGVATVSLAVEVLPPALEEERR